MNSKNISAGNCIKFIICLVLCESIIPIAVAAPDMVRGPSDKTAISITQGTNSAPSVNSTLESNTSPAISQILGKVVIRLMVPQKTNCADSFIIYPYPVKPPTNDKKLQGLPKSMKQLRTLLYASGYASRINSNKPYPTGGWRWRYIFQTAVDKSKMDLPHSVATAGIWVDDIVPYVLPELKKVNMAERARIVHYNKAQEFWEVNGVDMENNATLTGRRPHEVFFDKNWTARSKLTEGYWWIVGTHHASGLVFYWQEPVKVTAGKFSFVDLDEWNALVVQGAW